MRWCWHNWTKWSKLIMSYTDVHQYKQCKKCGLVKKKRHFKLDFNLNQYDGSEYSHKQEQAEGE